MEFQVYYKVHEAMKQLSRQIQEENTLKYCIKYGTIGKHKRVTSIAG